jgi:uncharacterized membrane protein (DUF106 family)
MAGGFQGIIDAVFNPVFGWLLHTPPILALLILATLLAVVSTLLQKYLTDQAKMRRLRDDTKRYQEQMKKLKDKPEEMMKVQQKMLPLQMDLMKESFKPLLVSMLPFLLIFFWLSSHFAFLPILPGQEFTVTATFADGVGGSATLASTTLVIPGAVQVVKDGAAQWTLTGSGGTHDLTLEFSGATYNRKVLITNEPKYETPVMPLRGSVTSFDVGNKKLTPLDGFSLFGWHPGWIFYYILFSIPLSLLLKKWMKVV